MVRTFLTTICLPLLTAVASAGSMDGKWLGRGQVSETAIKIWLDVSDAQDGAKLELDFLIGQGMARIGDEDGEPRYEGGKLHWKVDAASLGTFLCQANRIDENKAEAICKQGGQELRIGLTRYEGNKWLSSQLETVADGVKQKRFVKAVADVVRALSVDDFETFDGYFVDNPKGTLPRELFRRGMLVVMKFGQIQKIAFSEFEDPGAFVTVHFAENKRDFYVHLDDAGKIIELTYVPQPDPHFQ